MSNVYYLGRVFRARRLIAWKESAVPKVTDEGWCYDLAEASACGGAGGSSARRQGGDRAYGPAASSTTAKKASAG